MDNKKLGVILIVACVLLAVFVFLFHQQIADTTDASCSCTDGEESFCPHDQETPWLTIISVIILAIIAALGVYLIFFEKSQKEIVSTLKKQKKHQTKEEKFSMLLKGLNDDEKKVIRAVKEQDGISQQTLRLRTDLHKSKLSIVLAGLEKKNLVKKEKKGKTNRVYLKIKL